jgi:hypothetical protein
VDHSVANCNDEESVHLVTTIIGSIPRMRDVKSITIDIWFKSFHVVDEISNEVIPTTSTYITTIICNIKCKYYKLFYQLLKIQVNK